VTGTIEGHIVKRWFKRFIIAGIVGFLLMIGIVVWIRSARISRGIEQLNAAIAETESVDPNWRWDDLETSRRKVIPDDQNIAVIVFQFDAAERSLPIELAPFSTIEMALEDVQDSPNVRMLDDDANIVRHVWSNLGPMLALFEQLKVAKEGYFPLIIQPDWVSTPLPHTQRYRTAFAMCHVQSMLAIHDGKMQEAGESIRMHLRLVASMGDGPLLIGQLVRISGGTLARSSLERALGQGMMPEPILAELQTLFDAESQFPFFAAGIRGERAGWHHLMTNVQNGTVKPTLLFHSTGSRDFKDFLNEWRMMPYIPQNNAHMLRFCNRCIEIGKLPSWEQVDAMKAIEFPPSDREWVFAGLLMRVTKPVHETEMRQEAWLKCASVAIACERFRMKHHRWPTAFGELVPEFIEQVPLDPHTGKPLLLQQTDDGLVVYSTGTDRVDDHGRLWTSGLPTDEGFDFGFRLWNPDARRLPAKEREPEELDVMPAEVGDP